MSPTVIRWSVLLGTVIGSFIALVKLVPERTKLIMDGQIAAITVLQSENRRLVETVARLENDVIHPLQERVRELEKVNSDRLS